MRKVRILVVIFTLCGFVLANFLFKPVRTFSKGVAIGAGTGIYISLEYLFFGPQHHRPVMIKKRSAPNQGAICRKITAQKNQ